MHLIIAFFTGIAAAWQSPVAATYFVAELYGMPELVEPMLRICGRESRGSKCGPLVGVHKGDAKYSASVYKSAVRVGNVKPWCQPYEDGQWSSRGCWGLMAGYQLHRLGVPCLPPDSLDVPLVSALIAASKLTDHCSKPKSERAPSTSRWEGSDCEWKWSWCANMFSDTPHEWDEDTPQSCAWVRQEIEDRHLTNIIADAVQEMSEQ